MKQAILVVCTAWTFIASCDSKVVLKPGQNITDAGFGYPDPDKIDPERSKTRVPLYIPGKCPENQLLYPGNQENDWVCDCRSDYLYYAPKDGCFAAYRQGPCPEKHILFLPKGNFTPICVSNPCEKDGFVKYLGACYELDKPEGPCKPIKEGGGIFGVNSSTLELGCIKETDRLSIIKVPRNCPPGSQADANDICRIII